jgi:hypothetical protein
LTPSITVAIPKPAHLDRSNGAAGPAPRRGRCRRRHPGPGRRGRPDGRDRLPGRGPAGRVLVGVGRRVPGPGPGAGRRACCPSAGGPGRSSLPRPRERSSGGDCGSRRRRRCVSGVAAPLWRSARYGCCGCPASSAKALGRCPCTCRAGRRGTSGGPAVLHPSPPVRAWLRWPGEPGRADGLR